jgi:hypothetical protein
VRRDHQHIYALRQKILGLIGLQMVIAVGDFDLEFRAEFLRLRGHEFFIALPTLFLSVSIKAYFDGVFGFLACLVPLVAMLLLLAPFPSCGALTHPAVAAQQARITAVKILKFRINMAP